jgi:hypothetical protein
LQLKLGAFPLAYRPAKSGFHDPEVSVTRAMAVAAHLKNTNLEALSFSLKADSPLLQY